MNFRRPGLGLLLAFVVSAAPSTAYAVGTADGFVSVGTTTNPASEFGVYGGVTIGTSYNNTLAPTNGLLVQGNVGIGITSPQTVLSIGGNVSAPSWPSGIDFTTSAATYTDTTSVGSALVNYRAVSNFGVPTLASTNAITVSDAATVTIAGAPNAGTNTTITNPLALEAFGNIKAYGITGFGTTDFFAGALPSLTVGTDLISQYGLTLAPGNFTNLGLHLSGFYGVALYTGGLERMRVTNSGNVGIGTTSPQSKLHILSGEVQVGSSGVSCTSNNAGAISYASGALSYCNGSVWTSTASGNGNVTGIGSTGYDALWTSPTAIGTGLIYETGGKVGIGTTSPIATLDINGYAHLAKNSAQPIACDAAHDGSLALASTRRPCECVGTAWIDVVYGTACSW